MDGRQKRAAEKSPRGIDGRRKRSAEKSPGEVEEPDGRKIAGDPMTGFTALEKLFPSLSQLTVSGVNHMHLRYISQDCGRLVQHLLNGHNVHGCDWYGWEKTLGLLIPAVELIHKNSIKPRDGTVVLVICSTSVIAAQTHYVAQKLLRSRSSISLCVGDSDPTKPIEEGVNLLITTHRRLLDHIESPKGFLYENLQYVVIDATHQFLGAAFFEPMKKIVEIIPKGTQTVLFYSTWSEQVDDLGKSIFQTTTINCDCGTGVVINDKTKLLYCVIPTEKRLLRLYSFLRMNEQKKVIVFFSSAESVQFHAKVFQAHGELHCLKVHGKWKRRERASKFFQFCEAKNGILLCTHGATQHLNIPVVDWIVSCDAPTDPEQYIRKVYQGARWEDARTNILFFLAPEELEFIRHLEKANVCAAECELPYEKWESFQIFMETNFPKNGSLKKLAAGARRAHISAYCMHPLNDAFDVHKLNSKDLDACFGFPSPP